MSDPVSGARSARENLAQGLAALQAPGVPPHLMNVAEPIAKAMSALHQIEASGGAAAPQHAPVALEAVRGALAQLQGADGVHPAVTQAMEAVASSLGLVHSLNQAPPQAAFQAAPAAAAPAPQGLGSTVAIDGPSTQPSQGVGSTVPIGSNTQATGSTLELPPIDGAPPGIPRPTPQAAPQAYAQPQAAPQQQAYAQPAPQAQPQYQQPAPQYQQPPQQQAPQYQQPPQQQAPQYQQPPQQAPQYQQPPQQAPQYQQPPQQAPQYQQPPQQAPQYQQPPQQQQPQAAPAAYAQPQQAAPPAQPAPQARPPAAGPPAFGDVLRLEAALGANSQTNFYKGLSGNDVIDDGGIFIATYQIPDMGQPLMLKVSMPGGYEFEAKAIVRWTREAPNSGADAPPGFGAAFTEITPEGRQLVYRYVRNREPLFHDDF
ncbi:MAG: PilZ domain-containing protein [Polyangiaceae bacterium]|nr:PilZ domain-containing protein [Polyangiaceae bacterium]